MAYVIETPNPFEPTKDVKKYRVAGGLSIWQTLRQLHGEDFQDFSVPTICIVNGQARLRSQWDREIQDTDVVNFVMIPEGPFILIAILVIVLVAVTFLVAGAKAPAVPGSAPASDPVFTNKGQQNAIRLGEPIECCYGKNRVYPSYAARPYYQYTDNDQFQYSLYCLGQGEYEIEAIQIGDSPIANYAEVQYEVIPPGGSVTLFPTNVITSVEAGGQTLFAPNEEEYVAPGWNGPFSVNPANSVAYKIEVDVIFPKGLYVLSDEGNLQNASITFEVQIREIDNAGAPLGPFVLLASEVVTMATTTPQRLTFSYNSFVQGRYEVRLRRVDTKNLSYKAGHDIVWEGLRGFVNVEQDFGNVTLLAVVIRATNNLNDQTQRLLNVIHTRKLRIYESGGLSTTLHATRSIVWAFVDNFSSRYGGRVPERFFLWDDLLDLDALYTSHGDYFDWIFRDPITVWDGAKAIARVGRAVPLLVGSLVTIKRDTPMEIPVTMFTADNIIAGSFEYAIKLWDLDENDSIEAEYTEPATGYKQEQVMAILPGGTGDNPKRIQFPGIGNRAQAFREAMYMLAAGIYLRENVTLQTGLDGIIPSYGDLVAVQHDMPKWGQNGYVVHAEHVSNGTYLLWVSEPLLFLESGTYVILLRSRTGGTVGPFTVTATSDSKQIYITIPLDSDGLFDFLLGGKSEPMIFVFGISGNITKYCRVVEIEPQGGESVRLSLVNDEPIIHSFDSVAVPALNELALAPKAPDLPEVKVVYIHQSDPTFQIVQIAWTAAFGAQYYVVQTSIDGTNWTEQVTTVRTSLQVQMHPGPFYVRVAGVNSGRGPWKQAFAELSVILGLDLLIPWDALEWKVGWLPVLAATQYQVKVYDNAHSSPILHHTSLQTGTTYLYNYTTALGESDLTRHMLIEVDAVFGVTPTGTPASLELFNEYPTGPIGESAAWEADDSDQRTYRLNWTNPDLDDLHKVKIYLSPIGGFDPTVTSPYSQEVAVSPGAAFMPTTALVGVPLDSDGSHPVYYWRIALFDVWGDEIVQNSDGSGNISEEHMIAAFP